MNVVIVDSSSEELLPVTISRAEISFDPLGSIESLGEPETREVNSYRHLDHSQTPDFAIAGDSTPPLTRAPPSQTSPPTLPSPSHHAGPSCNLKRPTDKINDDIRVMTGCLDWDVIDASKNKSLESLE
ncbi:hypothetical protein Adt_48946 [Abeliophyllum distichum]|uniref:Uncharacterized protein n=1 Tax=Abeliophyllum distichum TaxID=126358 RepID=A0ABD1NQC4_9LAMI